MNEILIVRPDGIPEHDFAREILKSEGLFHFVEVRQEELAAEALRGAACVVALRGDYGEAAAELVLDYVRRGGLVAVMPGGALAEKLGLRPWSVEVTQDRPEEKEKLVENERRPGVFDVVTNGTVRVHPNADIARIPLPPEPLLCPMATAWSATCEGEALADLHDDLGKLRGPAIVRQRIGRGTACVMNYDVVGAVIRLRHGTGSLAPDPSMAPLRGPRHIYGLIGVADLHSRQYPLADIHQDVLRELILGVHAPGLVPRLWHLPDAARTAAFCKSDGCGEEGAPVGLELAERYGHQHNFFRPPASRFDGATIRAWRDRGHYMSMEVDVYPVTDRYDFADMDEAVNAEIRDVVVRQTDRFVRETGIEIHDIVVHGCQWTGADSARILMDHGWRMPFHFCGHDPRMSRANFGPFSVASGLPLRYYDNEAGVIDLWYQPCTIDDSQSITEPSEGSLGLSQLEYADTMVRWILDSRNYWHAPHIGTFHPCYLVRPKGDPRRTFEAASMVYAALAAEGISMGHLGDWSAFVQARDVLEVEVVRMDEGATVARISAPRAVDGLTVIADGEGTCVILDGRELPLRTIEIEGRRARVAVVSFEAGQASELVLKRS